MRLQEILQKYDDSLLDQISSDKVDEAISLRLPRPLIIQEIVMALSSLSYISEKITYAKPPAFAILDILLQSPGNRVNIERFREQVIEYVNKLSQKAEAMLQLQTKNYTFYAKIINRAWENDGAVDKSEAYILDLIKAELGIWDREHYVLGHHASILKMWDINQEYYNIRNYLLATGILLTDDHSYLIAEEVATQLKRTFGIELFDNPYKRLLSAFTREELGHAAQSFNLYSSGSKEEVINRLLEALIPPQELLNIFPLESLRELCRQKEIPVSGTKNTVINNVIQFFDQEKDIAIIPAKEQQSPLPAIPEERELSNETLTKVLFNLTNQQLYDILEQSFLPTSGSKEEKVRKIIESPWSDRSIFNRLRKDDLSLLCKKYYFSVSGSKQELIDRLLNIKASAAVSEVQGLNSLKENYHTELLNTGNEKPAFDSDTEAPLPDKFGEITTKFPELNQEEKIVLAVLKDIKSLTELDLERVALKHNLRWFLYKAQMSELMAKLKRNGKNVIKIKSLQNTNIYQWTDTDNKKETLLEKKSARDIIDALRHGVVPKYNLDLLMVGQQNAKKHLSQILTELNQSKSHFKFIRGQYGSGKTFLCSWLKEYALENEFVVSFLNVSHDQPLSDLPVFFSGVLNNLRTPEKSDSSALADILESWLLNIQIKTEQIEVQSLTNEKKQESIFDLVGKRIESELSALNDIEPGIPQALRSFYKGKVEGNQKLAADSLAWITGSRSLSAQTLREIGVKGYLEAHNVFERMRALLYLINGARYKGLLLLVDELELVRKFPYARQREQALETLRLLIDESGKNALPGCLIVFTGTDEFFEDERYGLKSYEALAERVLTPLRYGDFVSMRQPIISLESLDKERLANVIFKIRELYGIAYNCDARQLANDTAISQLIDNWTIFGDENIDRKPRPILREFIQMLDLCEENKGLSIEEFIKKDGLHVENNVATISSLN